MRPLPPRPDWMDSAACARVDPELFYPQRRDYAAAQTAKRICRICPHVQACLLYALDNNELAGIWGGTTGKERLHLLATRRRDVLGEAA